MPHHGRTRRSALAVLSVTSTAALALGVGATPALASSTGDPSVTAASTPSAYDPLSSAPAAATQTGAVLTARTVLTSTTGEKLTFDVTGFRASEGSTVVVALSQQGESHSWSFPAKASDVTVNGKGAGRITLSPASTGGLGELDLSFSPAGAVKKQTCGGDLASKRRPVSVRGKARLDTGTAAWGAVGSSKKATAFKNSQVLWSYDVDCPAPEVPCTDSLDWSGFETAGQTVTGISGSVVGGESSITAYRSTPLPSPSGAYRTDLRTVIDAPAPTLGGTGEERTPSAELGTGSLSITGLGATSQDSPCGTGGTATETSWFGTVENGSPAFSVPAQVFGDFTLDDDAFASFSRTDA